MRAEVIDEAAGVIDASCSNYVSSGEVDPTPWLDDVCNYFLDVSARSSGNDAELFAVVREKLTSDLMAAKAQGTPAGIAFIEALRQRIDVLDQPYPAIDASDLGPSFRPYRAR